MKRKISDEVYQEVSRRTGIPVETVRLAYHSFWDYIRTSLRQFDFNGMTEETLMNTRRSFNIPSIGKIYCLDRKVLAIGNKISKYGKDSHNKDGSSNDEQNHHNSRQVQD